MIFKAELLIPSLVCHWLFSACNLMWNVICTVHAPFYHMQAFPNHEWATCCHIHLVQKVRQRFLEPAGSKYPTTVNNSKIYILLSRPCSWMWHLKCWNCVRNGSARITETGETRSPKLENSYRHCAVILQCEHARIHSLNQQKVLWLDRPFLLHLNAVLIIRVIIDSSVSVLYYTLSIGIFKSAPFGERTRCFRPSIAAISHTISAHKVSH